MLIKVQPLRVRGTTSNSTSPLYCNRCGKAIRVAKGKAGHYGEAQVQICRKCQRS